MYAQAGRAYKSLGFLPAATAASAGLGPVGIAVITVSVVGSLYSVFKDWFQRGELKLAATAKAENFVESVWGTLQPNSPPEQDSVSKLIEACQLDAAQEMINFLARQMFEKAKEDSYFDRWMREWGFLTLTQIQNKLTAYRGYCTVTQEPPGGGGTINCPSGFTYDGTKCIPLSCPPGFQLIGGRCEMVSPSVLPPALDSTGGYVPLPTSSGLGNFGMFGILAVLFAAIVISR